MYLPYRISVSFLNEQSWAVLGRENIYVADEDEN
jgi:hypothetical protein